MSNEPSPYEVSESAVTFPPPISPPANPSKVAKVFGIIHLVYAAMGMMSAVSTVAMIFMLEKAVPMMGPAGKEVEMMVKLMKGMMSYAYLDMVVKLVFGVILLIAGIGLIKKKKWAAKLSVSWAVARVVAAIVMVLVMMGPTAKMTEKMAEMSGDIASDSLQLQNQIGGIGDIFTVIMIAIYPIVCIVFLSKSSVKQALK